VELHDRHRPVRALHSELVVNARDASAPGGRIEVSSCNVPRRELDRTLWPDLAPGDYVACRVRDYGTGMPPDVVRRACEPFFTSKAHGRGTGLGLSQVFGFARQSGGGIHIDSEVGIGTTITLLLPRAADDPVMARDNRAPALHQHAAPDLQPQEQPTTVLASPPIRLAGDDSEAQTGQGPP
jgi:nitrogen-specific signal transduction histidine kinase